MQGKMNYVAWYRKYRPTKFSDVVGQKYLVESLKNIVKSGNFFHAYLFSGPRGTGKTSLAKIFANTINCAHKSDVLEPCKLCIQNINTSLDIIEMDAASHNGVREIREISENIVNLPQVGKFKIYILDEVHMLSSSAFNAFLKTLEEPPSHVIFILATTEVHKIPLTILSRVQRYNFLTLNEEEVCQRLEFILKNEEIDYEKNALKSIFSLSKGSLRDAISILEQVVTFGNGILNQASINELFGLTTKEKLVDFTNALFAGESKTSFAILQKIFSENKNYRLFLESLINLVKEWIFWKSTQSVELLEIFSVAELNKIKINREFAYKFLQIAFTNLKDFDANESQSLALEIFAMKILAETQVEFKNDPIFTVQNSQKDEVVEQNSKQIVIKNYEKTQENITSFQKIEDRLQRLKLEAGIEKNFNFRSQIKEIPVNENLEKVEKKPDFLVQNEKKNQNPFIFQKLNENNFDSNPNSKDVVKHESFANLAPEKLSENHDLNLDSQKKTQPKNSLNSLNIFNLVKSTFSKQKFNKETKTNLNEKIEFQGNSPENFSEFDYVDNKNSIINDYLNVEQVINLALLDRRFKKKNPGLYEKMKEEWKNNMISYEFDSKFMQIISVFKHSIIFALDTNMICLYTLKKEYESFLIEIAKKNIDAHYLISLIFGKQMHFYAISKELFNKAKEKKSELSKAGKKIEPKPLPNLKGKNFTEEDLEKLSLAK
ncbi:DNA polymerase III subunit gamma/tau [Mycoplasma sp. 'Moose RK']|uniref:DNA polymerase III subunit gamma/tau n=1 Tax=Mycoplasma sp. 'Moose RK' TaxID=2780095 RepID=UPI0018C267BE|nr:DNA polymerase III subunit gamma/tau [Mycoplasma sp. 'Moose RK']MBG0730989.1 DNA polymerase III subunit gamma/tau [Mycoplasma sp. 'Moose RK']